MKYLLIPFIALSVGSAAYATDYPPCSKTVQDECTNPSQMHHAKTMKTSQTHMRHAALHHSGPGKTERSAKS